MSECEIYQELISRKLDEALSPAEENALADHLHTCPDCARMAEAFAALSQSLSQELEDAPEHLCTEVMAQVHRAHIQQKNRSRGRVLKLALTAAACAALLLVIGTPLRAANVTRNDSAVFARPEKAQGVVTAAAPAAPAPERIPAPAAAVPDDFPAESSGAVMDAMPAPEEAASADLAFSGFSLPRGTNRPPLVWEELTALLLGEVAAAEVQLPEEPALVLTVEVLGVYQDVAFYQGDGCLCYTDPADQQQKRSLCTLDQLLELSN